MHKTVDNIEKLPHQASFPKNRSTIRAIQEIAKGILESFAAKPQDTLFLYAGHSKPEKRLEFFKPLERCLHQNPVDGVTLVEGRRVVYVAGYVAGRLPDNGMRLTATETEKVFFTSQKRPV